jgi:hypothetical protein
MIHIKYTVKPKDIVKLESYIKILLDIFNLSNGLGDKSVLPDLVKLFKKKEQDIILLLWEEFTWEDVIIGLLYSKLIHIKYVEKKKVYDKIGNRYSRPKAFRGIFGVLLEYTVDVIKCNIKYHRGEGLDFKESHLKTFLQIYIASMVYNSCCEFSLSEVISKYYILKNPSLTTSPPRPNSVIEYLDNSIQGIGAFPNTIPENSMGYVFGETIKNLEMIKPLKNPKYEFPVHFLEAKEILTDSKVFTIEVKGSI